MQAGWAFLGSWRLLCYIFRRNAYPMLQDAHRCFQGTKHIVGGCGRNWHITGPLALRFIILLASSQSRCAKFWPFAFFGCQRSKGAQCPSAAGSRHVMYEIAESYRPLVDDRYLCGCDPFALQLKTLATLIRPCEHCSSPCRSSFNHANLHKHSTPDLIWEHERFDGDPDLQHV